MKAHPLIKRGETLDGFKAHVGTRFVMNGTVRVGDWIVYRAHSNLKDELANYFVDREIINGKPNGNEACWRCCRPI